MYQSTLLHAAARHGHAQLAAALLERGADANALDYGGMRRSALHWACRGGHVQLVEMLVEAGADTKVGRAVGLAACNHAQLCGVGLHGRWEEGAAGLACMDHTARAASAASAACLADASVGSIPPYQAAMPR